MKNESILAAKFVGVCLIMATVAIVLGATFRFEIMEKLSDTLSNNAFAVKRNAVGRTFIETEKFELRPERDDIEFIRITGLKTGEGTAAGTPISFTLTNQGDSNSYPSVKIVLVNRGGAAVRQLVFTEKDYAHPLRFEEHEVELLLSLQQGETGFTAKPFYPEKP